MTWPVGIWCDRSDPAVRIVCMVRMAWAARAPQADRTDPALSVGPDYPAEGQGKWHVCPVCSKCDFKVEGKTGTVKMD